MIIDCRFEKALCHQNRCKHQDSRQLPSTPVPRTLGKFTLSRGLFGLDLIQELGRHRQKRTKLKPIHNIPFTLDALCLLVLVLPMLPYALVFGPVLLCKVSAKDTKPVLGLT